MKLFDRKSNAIRSEIAVLEQEADLELDKLDVMRFQQDLKASVNHRRASEDTASCFTCRWFAADQKLCRWVGATTLLMTCKLYDEHPGLEA